MTRKTAISLFSSGGIGDLAIRACGYDILVSNEILPDRHAVFQRNFPQTLTITGDIWRMLDQIESATRSRLVGGESLTLLYATPPCQGMSKNGRGKLLNGIRAGRKAPMDDRNRLIIPTIELARRLRPEIVLLENVPEMANTIIVEEGGAVNSILDYVQRELGTEYAGRADVVEFADFGVPQRRQRLISVYSRNPMVVEWLARFDTALPPATHSRDASLGTNRWVTLREVIGNLPPLDARDRKSATSNIPFHRVPVLDSLKYWWVENTQPEHSAFDNQCAKCGFDGNPIHIARRDLHGINRASTTTPLYCERCGEVLPRPSVERRGRREIMRGFTSAYKRMSYDKPAPALTRNLSYACSDNKLHPSQNRVLSLFESFRIHTVDQFEYAWERSDGKPISDKTIREIIGESIPPLGLQAIVRHLDDIADGTAMTHAHAMLGPLFA